MNSTPYDHVYEIDGHYYWVDETGDLSLTGFSTPEDAKEELDRYVIWLNTGEGGND